MSEKKDLIKMPFPVSGVGNGMLDLVVPLSQPVNQEMDQKKRRSLEQLQLDDLLNNLSSKDPAKRDVAVLIAFKIRRDKNWIIREASENRLLQLQSAELNAHDRIEKEFGNGRVELSYPRISADLSEREIAFGEGVLVDEMWTELQEMPKAVLICALKRARFIVPQGRRDYQRAYLRPIPPEFSFVRSNLKVGDELIEKKYKPFYLSQFGTGLSAVFLDLTQPREIIYNRWDPSALNLGEMENQSLREEERDIEYPTHSSIMDPSSAFTPYWNIHSYDFVTQDPDTGRYKINLYNIFFLARSTKDRQPQHHIFYPFIIDPQSLLDRDFIMSPFKNSSERLKIVAQLTSQY